MNDYHSRMTSLGTKRGIAPYWSRYRRGRSKAFACPYYKKTDKGHYCSIWEKTFYARDLFYDKCSGCNNVVLDMALRPVFIHAQKWLKVCEKAVKNGVRLLKEKVADWKKYSKLDETSFFRTTKPLKEYADEYIRFVRADVDRLKEARVRFQHIKKRYDEARQ